MVFVWCFCPSIGLGLLANSIFVCLFCLYVAVPLFCFWAEKKKDVKIDECRKQKKREPTTSISDLLILLVFLCFLLVLGFLRLALHVHFILRLCVCSSKVQIVSKTSPEPRYGRCIRNFILMMNQLMVKLIRPPNPILIPPCLKDRVSHWRKEKHAFTRPDHPHQYFRCPSTSSHCLLERQMKNLKKDGNV